MRIERARLLLGMPVEPEEAGRLIAGCEVEREDGLLLVTVPTFRRDLGREADLIEEVGRLTGLEEVPEELPASRSLVALLKSSARSGCSGCSSPTSA